MPKTLYHSKMAKTRNFTAVKLRTHDTFTTKTTANETFVHFLCCNLINGSTETTWKSRLLSFSGRRYHVSLSWFTVFKKNRGSNFSQATVKELIRSHIRVKNGFPTIGAVSRIQYTMWHSCINIGSLPKCNWQC